jgi:sigma-E factor negative regulatory protein RseB
MMKWRLIGILLFMPVTPAQAETGGWFENSKTWVQQLWRNDARQWLERIDSAVLNHNYKGIVVLVQGSAVESFAVDHRMTNGVETLRMRTLSGVPKELVKKGEQFQIDAQTGAGSQNMFSIKGQAAFSQFASAADNKSYSTKMGGKGRVAERPAQIIDIKAEDKLRYSHRLWLDEETGLPLRVVTLDDRGRIIEQMVFTQIAVTNTGSKSKQKRAPALKALDNPYEDVKGFRLIGVQSQGMSRHLLYSDGLTSVSLYIEPSTSMEKAQMKKDAVNGLMLGNGKTRHVVLGKVPFATLELFLAATAP